MFLQLETINGKTIVVRAEDIAVIGRQKNGSFFVLGTSDDYIYEVSNDFDEFVKAVADKGIRIIEK